MVNTVAEAYGFLSMQYTNACCQQETDGNKAKIWMKRENRAHMEKILWNNENMFI